MFDSKYRDDKITEMRGAQNTHFKNENNTNWYSLMRVIVLFL